LKSRSSPASFRRRSTVPVFMGFYIFLVIPVAFSPHCPWRRLRDVLFRFSRNGATRPLSFQSRWILIETQPRLRHSYSFLRFSLSFSLSLSLSLSLFLPLSSSPSLSLMFSRLSYSVSFTTAVFPNRKCIEILMQRNDCSKLPLLHCKIS